MFKQLKNIMKVLTDLIARLLFAIPMAVFGLLHFMNAEGMAGMAPFGGVFIVYLTGVALIAAAVAIIIDKQAYLAGVLLGVFLLLTAFTVHLPTFLGGDQMAMSNILKDVALAGGAWFIAGAMKDK